MSQPSSPDKQGIPALYAGRSQERKVAFCVGLWSSDSILYAWTYAKQYFLRKKRSESGSDVLDPLDKLYVVHVQHSDKKAERKERWDAGGPLLPSLATALANFPHKVVELEKDSDTKVFKVLLEFAEREGIDVMILGNRENKTVAQSMLPGTKKYTSTADNFKARARCPALVIRPAAARNEKMRIQTSSGVSPSTVAAQQQTVQQVALSRNASLPSHLKGAIVTASHKAEDRKVVIAFDSVPVGRNLARWAFQTCLFPDDAVSLVCCTNPKPSGGIQKSLSRRSVDSNRPADIESISQELPRLHVARAESLRGDAKDDLCELADEWDADLLIVAASSAQGLRKTFGTSTSTYLVHHAPCPTLVIPVGIALAGVEEVTSPQESRELRGDTDEEMDPIMENEGASSPGPPESPTQPDERRPTFSLGQGMMKVKSLERSASGRGWFSKQDRGQSRGDRGDQAQLQQLLQEKDATIEALQEEVRVLKQRLSVLSATAPSRAGSFAL